MSMLTNNIKYGIRQLLKTPVFSIIAIFSLAIGIGANTAVFSLINSVKLKTLPVTAPEELIMFRWETPSVWCLWHKDSFVRTNADKDFCSDAFRYEDYCYLRDNVTSVPQLTAHGRLYGLHINVQGKLGRAEGMMVDGNFFDFMGLKPYLGRLLSDSDNLEQSEPVAVISYKCWRDTFNSDPKVAGKDVILEDTCMKVIGVLPEAFIGVYQGTRIDYVIPASLQKLFSKDFRYGYEVVARAKNDKQISAVRAEVALLIDRLVQPRSRDGNKVDVEVFADKCPAGNPRYNYYLSKPLPIMAGLVAVVLLLACVNLAGLLLVRGITRQHEFAVRQAFGARRINLIYQLFIEIAILSFLGAVIGLVLSSLCKTVLARMLWNPDISLYQPNDWRVISFTLLATLLTMLIFGLLPALRATKVEVFTGLKNKFSDGIVHMKLGGALVVVQIGLALFLLTGAVMLVKTLNNLDNIDVGFNVENILTFELNPRSVGYDGPEIIDFHDRAQEAFAGIPGVKAVSCSQTKMLGWSCYSMSVRDLTLPNNEVLERFSYNFMLAGKQFLHNMQIPLVWGRDFEESDSLASANTIILNETLAKELYGEANPVGLPFAADPRYTVIGVCRDFKPSNIKQEVSGCAIFNVNQKARDVSGLYFQLKTTIAPEKIIPSVRLAVADIDNRVYVSNISSQADVLSDQTRRERLFACFTGGFAGMALLLSCIGLYGILSFQVNRRRREIGIRMALGATCKGLMLSYLQKVTIMAVIGFALALPAIYAGRQIISSYLWGIEPFDPASIMLSMCLLYIVLLFSAYIPARRASTIDPMEALRYE